MEDRLEVTNDGLDSGIIGCPTQDPIASSSRKPSILRKQMLRRTSTRTRKRPPESVGTTPTDGEAMEETIEDVPSIAPAIVQPITIPQISSLESDDTIQSLQLISELEVKKRANNDRNDATEDGDDVNPGLDISIIESDDEASGVEVFVTEEDESEVDDEAVAFGVEVSFIEEHESEVDDEVVASGVEVSFIEEHESEVDGEASGVEVSLIEEDESETEVEVDDEVDSVPVEQTPEEKPIQTKAVTTLIEEDESEAEVEVDGEVDIVPVEQIPEEKPTQTKAVTTLIEEDKSEAEVEVDGEVDIVPVEQIPEEKPIQTKAVTTLIEEDKSEAEVEVDGEVEIVPVEQIPEEKPTQTKAVTTSAVSSQNLSIVLKGNDIVVEYRDDKSKEALPPKAPFSFRQTPAPNRPKGIMKRPRHSKIKYHHPRRPLPPPLPPPGYKEISTSPKSCVTATSIDSGYSSAGNHQPLKKRVSFNERELVEQYQMSKQRRKAKYDKRRSFLGILSMAMPVVMPYLMAVLILVASSMVPLPTDQNHQQQRQQALSMYQEFEANLPRPVQPPIFLDVGSRMWEERRANEEASAI